VDGGKFEEQKLYTVVLFTMCIFTLDCVVVHTVRHIYRYSFVWLQLDHT